MIILVGLCIVLCLLAALTAASCFCFQKAPANEGKKKDAIILLGYPAKKDGTPSPIMTERIKKAAELYRGGIAPTVICSGAAVANQFAEADVMARELAKLGVPASDILRDTKARDTYENLANSKQIMQSRGLKTAVVVSSPWHLRKAGYDAMLLNLDCTSERSENPREYPVIYIGILYLELYLPLLVKLAAKRLGK